jgi:hypothetical protein
MRRRLRFLRKARELAYRDLGGLLFEMHRLGQRHDELVAAKLTTLGHIDTELRTLQEALGERGAVTVLREAGVAACPRCAAIHGSDDRFCPVCGTPMGRRADRPIAATPPTTGAAEGPATIGPTAPSPAAAPQSALPPPPAVVSRPPTPAPPPTAATVSPPIPASPRTTAHPPVAAAPPPAPAGPDEDQPTKIIRPSDNTPA